MAIGLLCGEDPRILTRTSFGQMPQGHAALYDLLTASGVPVARSYAAPERLAPGRTIWWIEPDTLGGDRPAGSSDPIAASAPGPLAGDTLAAWIATGGTAVVLLRAERGGDATPTLLAGVAVPPTGELAATEAPPAETASLDAPETPEPPTRRSAAVDGSIVPGTRSLELEGPVVFVSADPARWHVVAALDGHPFVLETALGAGRLVVVADARFVSNAWLDQADAAPLALDLVRAYGDPWIDEHEHALVPSRSGIGYLVGSPALPFFVGLALLAIAFGWFGAALPPRNVPEQDPSAPTLEDFVASMAQMYAMTRDYPRVLARYRELTARQLRRQLGLPPDAPIASLAERLSRRRGISAQGLRLLSHGTPVRNAADLERAAAALNQLVEEVA